MNNFPSQSPPTYQAKVHCWETKVGREDGDGTTVGHTSLSLQQDGHTTSYWSMRPKNSLLVNPFLFFWPTKAICTSSLKEDMDHERFENLSGEPDRTLTLTLSSRQFNSLSHEIEEGKQKMENGMLRYQLFPALSILRPIRFLTSTDFYSNFSVCPFSNMKMGKPFNDQSNAISSMESSHCALSIYHMLAKSEAANISPLSNTPWFITPTNLGDMLKKQN